jgi:hypothetical protein
MLLSLEKGIYGNKPLNQFKKVFRQLLLSPRLEPDRSSVLTTTRSNSECLHKSTNPHNVQFLFGKTPQEYLQVLQDLHFPHFCPATSFSFRLRAFK